MTKPFERIDRAFFKTKEEPKKPSKAIEPFEYFVDFDEPDFSEPRLTDKDLYDEE